MIKDNLQQVLEQIESAAIGCGRVPDSVRLVAVSKTVPAEQVRAAIEAGVTTLGENYVQEARDKIEALADCEVSWHFIGHLQSNKAKYAVKLFDLIHSVDSVKLAEEIDKRAAGIDKTQAVLVQVNIAEEETKSGVSVEESTALVREISALKHLEVRGLMTMPPFFNQPERVRPYFKALRQLRDRIREMDIAGTALEELSMGMTGDFKVAIEEGATLVRIGTAIFGERT